jgi:hypothetical protein
VRNAAVLSVFMIISVRNAVRKWIYLFYNKSEEMLFNLDASTYFALGGLANAFFAVLHILLAIKPTWYRFFGADQLAEMHEKGSKFPRLVTMGLVLLFGIWSAYGLSAAGMIPSLPIMRTMIFIIIAIYFLRSLMIFREFFKVIIQKVPFRFLIFSSGAFATGLMYYMGLKGGNFF